MSGRHELPDPVPVAVPVGFRPPPSMVEMIRTYVRRELSQQAQDQGFESFEEADDFDVEDDPPDPRTPYEAVFDPPPEPSPPKPAVEPAAAAAAAPDGPAPST